MISLRNDLVETENRISKKVDDRIDKVDDHLSKQDERLDDIVDSAVVRKRTWSDGKKIVVTGVITLAAAVLTGLSTGILHF